MNESEREKLVDLVLGRLSRSESEALERRALVDSDLSTALAALREELEHCAAFAADNRALETALRRRFLQNPSSESSDAPALVSSPPSRAPRRREKKFAFVPKRAAAPPRRELDAFVFKRAVVMTTEARARRAAKSRASGEEYRRAELRASLLRDGESWSLVDSVPTTPLSFAISSRRRFEGVVRLDAFEETLDEPTASLTSPHSLDDAFAVPVKQPLSSVLSYSAVGDGASAYAVALGELKPSFFAVDASSRVSSTTEWTAPTTSNLISRFAAFGEIDSYRVLPLEYVQGRTRRVETARPFVFEELLPTPSPESASPLEITSESSEIVAPLASAVEIESPVESSPVASASEIAIESSEVVAPTASAVEMESPVESLPVASASEIAIESSEVVAPTASAVEMESPVESLPVESSPVASASEIAIESSEVVAPTASAVEIESPVASASEILVEHSEPESPRARVSEFPYPEFDANAEEVAPEYANAATIVPQTSAAYYASDVDEADLDELGPTLSAEDRRLAELLGRIPTAADLDEWYWETVGEANESERAKAKEDSHGLLSRFLLVATAPPVLVGRASIKAFRVIFPQDVERDERRRATRRDDRQKAGGFSDMMLSTVIGVLIAACLFWTLRDVVKEVYLGIVAGRVREISNGMALSPQESEDQILPFITERVFYPQSETGVIVNTEGSVD